jgi:caffeoyl-CoA O-methyltransferase
MKDPSFLKAMVQRVQARRVLEIGTSDGISALAMAEMLREDGTVVTCEVNQGLAALARKRLDRSPHGRKVEVVVGRALDTLLTITGPFDLIFVDADTPSYLHYYRRALELLAPSGMLLMDNTQGIALGPMERTKDPAIAVIQELAHILRADTRVHSQLIGVRDGVLVVTWATHASLACAQ